MSSDDKTVPVAPNATAEIATGDLEVVKARSVRHVNRTFQAGDIVAGKYRIVRFLAAGGMGEVYEAEDLQAEERVALKTVLLDVADHEIVIGRFKRELRLARKVGHKNICQTLDVGIHRTGGEASAEIRFLVMELLSGQTLAERLSDLLKQGRRLTTTEASPLVRQMAAALGSLHDHDIVHRDFKPANIFLEPGMKGERVVVTDFGIAKRTVDSGTEGAMSYTRTNDVVGTPAYMAPEQIGSGRDSGPAADIYALGVVMYEMVTGRRPFAENVSLPTYYGRKLNEAAPSPRLIVPDLDPRWEAVIVRCLEREPEKRYESIAELITALGGDTVRRDDPDRNENRYPSRRIWTAAAVILAVLLLGGLWIGNRPATPAESAGTSAPNAAPAPISPRPALAVLSFKNLGTPADAWVSAALAEMLRTEIAAGEALRTIPGESVTRTMRELSIVAVDSLARDTVLGLHRALGADFIVLGAYLIQNNRVRLDLRLQDAKTGEIVATGSEIGAADDVFTVATKAGALLRAKLGIDTPSPQQADAARSMFPVDPEARRLYSQGVEKLRLYDALEACKLLEQAAAIEPNHPGIHSALASAWFALGYDGKAADEAKRALELSGDLSREDRLRIEAQYYEITYSWDLAIAKYEELTRSSPDSLEYGLALAAAQTSGGKAPEAFATIAALRKLPPPAAEDPRIDLAEAAAAKAVTSFKRMQQNAARAKMKAGELRAMLLIAESNLAEGTALADLGQAADARATATEAVSLFNLAHDAGGAARARNVIAITHAQQGEFERAKQIFEGGRDAFRRIGDQRNLAVQIGNIGNTLVELGNLPEARRTHEEALLLSQKIADRRGIARGKTNLGSTLELMDELPEALRTLEEAVAAHRSLGAARDEALALANVAYVLYRQKRFAEAKKRYEQSLAISRGLDSVRDTARTLTDFADLLTALGDQAGAAKARQEAASAKELAASR